MSEAQPVEDAIKILQELCDFVASCKSEIQTVYAKKIAGLMVKIFESAVALEGSLSGDEREKAKAELFIQKTWSHFSCYDREQKVQYYFDLIVKLAICAGRGGVKPPII